MRTPGSNRDNDCSGSPQVSVLVDGTRSCEKYGLRVGETGQLRGRGQLPEAGGAGAAGPRRPQAAPDGEAEVQHAGVLEGHQQGHGVHRGLHVPEVSR